VSAGQAVVPQEVPEDLGVSVQLLVPLQVFVMQAVSVQLMAVPVHEPPPQVSPQVQAFESSQAVLVRQRQSPPVYVQYQVLPPQETVWHREWVVASQV
jgi:hypothetical protein